MTLDELIQSLTPEMYQNLRTAVELGRWPDGRRLEKIRSSCVCRRLSITKK